MLPAVSPSMVQYPTATSERLEVANNKCPYKFVKSQTLGARTRAWTSWWWPRWACSTAFSRCGDERIRHHALAGAARGARCCGQFVRITSGNSKPTSLSNSLLLTRVSLVHPGCSQVSRIQHRQPWSIGASQMVHRHVWSISARMLILNRRQKYGLDSVKPPP